MFEAEFQEARRHPGESVTDFGYRLQTLFMKGYPTDPNLANNANDTAMRFTVLRTKFLAGLEPEMGFKLKYTPNLATFDDLVAEAQQQDLRLRERRLLQGKRESVLSITQDNNVLNSTLATILERITKLEKDRNQSSSISTPNWEATNKLLLNIAETLVQMKQSQDHDQDDEDNVPNRSQYQRSHELCGWCGKYGHNQEVCFSRKRHERSLTLIWGACNQQGHYARICPN